MTRITISCEDCGRRHRLERTFGEPCMIWIVCHECELPIQATFDGPTEVVLEPATPSPSFHDAWAGMLDLSPSGTVSPSL